MKQCPYNLHLEQVNETRREYDESGREAFQCQKLVENQLPTPCIGKACGAWHFGRCRRRQ